MGDDPKREFVIVCATNRDDEVKIIRRVGRASFAPTREFRLEIGERGDELHPRKFVTFDKATARELFNWLGVELHKQGEG